MRTHKFNRLSPSYACATTGKKAATTLGGKTPAMAAGVTDHVWPLSELVTLLDNAEQAVPMKRVPYKKTTAAE